MRTRQQRVYLDANVLIAYLANEADRADVVQAVLNDAQEEKIELLTSVMSIAEVAYISADNTGEHEATRNRWEALPAGSHYNPPQPRANMKQHAIGGRA